MSLHSLRAAPRNRRDGYHRDTFDLISYTVAVAFGYGLPSAGVLGTTYSFRYTATSSGPSAAISFALNSGTLPPGLTLASDGLLSGTATQAGQFTFSVQATASNGATAVRQDTVRIVRPAPLQSGMFAVGETVIAASVAPTAGRETLTVTAPTSSTSLASTSATVAAGRLQILTIPPNKAINAAFGRQRSLKLTATLTFRPSDGSAATTTKRTVTLTRS